MRPMLARQQCSAPLSSAPPHSAAPRRTQPATPLCLAQVRYIRKEHGDFFGIGVAGYPEAHPDKIVDDPEEMKVGG